MSYTKTTWETGDTVTAEKLNNIENGVSGAYPDLVIEVDTAFELASAEDVIIKSGSIEACEEMVNAEQYINGMLVSFSHYEDDPTNPVMFLSFPIVSFDATYRTIYFNVPGYSEVSLEYKSDYTIQSFNATLAPDE